MSENRYHDVRFAFDQRREVLWQSLWKYQFRRYVRPTDCVLEIGCGYGHFINNVTARRRIGVDIWPGSLSHLADGVEGHVADGSDLAFIEDASVNFAFISNVVEHLPQASFARMLAHLKRTLASGGLVGFLQPNYRYAYREYFDDFTHVTVYSHVTLCDVLMAHGFDVVECHPRFLPLTIKSRFRVSPWLIWLYLNSPIKFFGKQMLIVAGAASGSPSRNWR